EAGVGGVVHHPRGHAQLGAVLVEDLAGGGEDAVGQLDDAGPGDLAAGEQVEAGGLGRAGEAAAFEAEHDAVAELAGGEGGGGGVELAGVVAADAAGAVAAGHELPAPLAAAGEEADVADG